MHRPDPAYPRPRLARDRWLSLDGPWEFGFDPDDRGMLDGASFRTEINVPFAPEWPLSGMGARGCHSVVWYRRSFRVPDDWRGDPVWLRFGAVDHACRVWVNDVLVGSHEGGHTPFGCDVTRALRSGANTVVVRAVDSWKDLTLPRGKQAWSAEPGGIFYMRTTGIWQTVWLEPVPEVHVVDVYASSRGDDVRFEIELSADAEVEVRVAGRTLTATGRSATTEATLSGAPRWSPESPNLIDVEVRCGSDVVRTYVGLRDIRVDGGHVYLDGTRLIQKLVLDQGYWPDGGLTPPSDQALEVDIAWTKAFGCNGVRKHQKVEDPRYLYHCDRAGLLVWTEMPSAYAFTPAASARLASEWREVVRRDRSHPCVVAWVPLNESWGVPDIRTEPRQQAFARSLCAATRSLDATRPVVDNDGWEHTEDTDLLTIHDYAPTGAELAREWSDGLPAGLHRPPLVEGASYRGQPVLISEYGGISYIPPDAEVPAGAWGYAVAESAEAFIERYLGLLRRLEQDPRIAGWCYTQLTDVEQETNGLLTFDRRPKVDPRSLRSPAAPA